MRRARDYSADFLTRIAPYVSSDGGRNLNKISRELSIPYQTLRFRMLHLKGDGISVLPIIDADKLGLERIRVFFTLNSDLGDVKSLFGALAQTAGLRYYQRSLLSNYFDAEFLIPRGKMDELLRLLSSLEELQIIKGVQARQLLWKDVLMMKTAFFDYLKKEWDIEPSRLYGDPATTIPPKSEREKFDWTDLLILKTLELDPWIKVVDLAESIHVQERDVAYHLNKHVFGRRLISSFRFRWVGTKNAWAKHSIVGMTLYFHRISDEAASRAMSVMTSTPFTWSHLRAQDGTYLVEMLIPVSWFPEITQHVSNSLRALNLVPQIFLPDWSCVSMYTIPYFLFDREKEDWWFDFEKSLDWMAQSIRSRH